MRELIRVRDARTGARQRLAALTLVGCVLALLAAPPARAASAVKDVRVGKHPTYTRIVFELDRAAGYQIERNEPAPGISELVVSLEASGIAGKVEVPKSLVDALRLQTDGRKTVAHIRLAKDGLRLKEMTLSQPPRIVIDVVDDQARVTAAKPASVPTPTPAAEPRTAPKLEPKPKSTASTVAVAPVPMAAAPPAATPAPKPVSKPAAKPAVEPEPAQPVVARSTEEAVEPPARPGAEKKTERSSLAAARTSDGPSDPTAPSAIAEPVVPAARSNGARTSLPPARGAPEAAGGIFTARNGALALAGIALLVAGSYVIAKRRRDPEDYDEFADDNPFAGPRREADDAEEALVGSAFGAQASPNAMVGPADTSPRTIDTAGAMNETEGFDVSVDGTTDFGADPDALTTLSSASGATPDLEGILRMVRELSTRVGDLETRLEDAVDAKERLERQVAVQTEELRVQRAAIARTQRAVRNMSQSTDDTPTEPASRVPRSGE